MEMTPRILFGKVMHKRHFPKQNNFIYGIYYLMFPLSRMHDMNDGWRFGVNKHGLMSFFEKDHGNRDNTSLHIWIKNIREEHNIDMDGETVLVTMPRIFGHVFNPVSFWLCYDQNNAIQAVVCEVNNTFGETHSYIYKPTADQTITQSDWIEAKKMFHVSPFLQREGRYRFRFSITDKSFGAWIDYYAEEGRKQLSTALTGEMKLMTRQSCRKAFWGYPMVAFIALIRIHWHALRLLVKGVRYIPKPLQKKERITSSDRVTKI